MSLEKTIYIGQLFSFYKALLTERQRVMLSLYYEEDFSLSEIADHFDISRQGVHDNIRRGENALKEYEASLHLNQKREERIQLLNELNEKLLTEETKNIVGKLIQMED